MYSQDQVNNFIGCLKKIKTPPGKKMKEERGAIRNSFTAISIENGITFSVFYMRNARFPENFSIGLTFNPPDQKGMITLIRCNGKHGPTKLTPHHSTFHVHRVTAERINRGLLEEGEIEITDAYADFDGALQYFLRIINLREEDRLLYFPATKNPGTTQLNLGI
jgi:hypothetical protein